MESPIKLSIIVPVYNVEKYIVKCIFSLLHPTEKNYEVIIVNDGTTDHSMEIIRDSFHDKRLRFLEKENGGLSSARNFGVKAAKGDYFWFFDSDDWAETMLLPEIISLLNDVDIFVFTGHYNNWDGSDSQQIHIHGKSCLTGRDLATSGYDHCVPFYIYSRKLWETEHLMFKEGLLHEDSLFTPITILKCKSVLCFNKPVYHRRIRPGSITRSEISPKRLNDLRYVICTLIEYGKSLDSLLRYKWGRCIAQLTNELLYCSMKCNSIHEREEVRKFVNGNREIHLYMFHSGYINKFVALLSTIWGRKLYPVYKVLYKIRY